MSASQNCIPTVPDCDQHPLCASCFLVSSYSWKLSGWDSAKCKVLESQKMVGYSRELFMGSWEGEGIHLTDCCFQSCWPCTFLWISLHLLKPTSDKVSALNFGDRFTTTGPVQSVHQLDCDQIFSTCFSGVET